MPRILVFGNSLVKGDSLPLKLAPRLARVFPEIEFIECDPSEDLESAIGGKELNALDTAKGILECVLVTDEKEIEFNRVYSLHDFGLGESIALLRKARLLEKIRVFCVPEKIGEKKALEQLVALLKKSFRKEGKKKKN
jgi:Ni,Fe-hydrogenase maturation factor